MENRPKGVLIVATILFFAAFVALIVAISIIFSGTPLAAIWALRNSFPIGFRNTSAGMVFGYFLLILGLIMLSAVHGLVKGRRWAWWIVIMIFAANGVGDAVSVALGGGINGISGILLAVLLVFYLTRPGVRKFFKNEIID
jgi:hypothetical protein